MKVRLPSEPLEEEPQSIESEDLPPTMFEEAQEAKPTNVQVAKELGDPTSTPKATPRKPKRKSVRVIFCFF